MLVSEILDNCDVQSEVRFVYFDDEEFERVTISEAQARRRMIRNIYAEDDILYLEVYWNE